MTTRRTRTMTSLLMAVIVGLASLVVASLPVQAQEDRYETCAAYAIIQGTGGQAGADAAATLQALGAPNPFGVDNVLEVIINGEADSPPVGSRPTADALEVAYQELDRYFGGVCAEIDICPLIVRASLGVDASAVDAARLARDISTPAPPGIDAALALIAGDISESPFHNSIADAQAQILSYFPCEPSPTEPSPTPEVPAEVDRCALVALIASDDISRATEAASKLREIETPSPPGIDAALALIAAEIDESPFHASIAEARLQIIDYYPCGEGADGGNGGGLAFTGSSATSTLTALGFGLLAAGTGVLRHRRRLLDTW